ncbi:MAG: YbjQ family protein [Desulfobulbaceae bacterium]
MVPRMLFSTTGNCDGYVVVEYLGIVSGTAVLGANIIKDIFASFTDVFGGRSKSYENELDKAKKDAMSSMTQEATSRKANAIIGISFDYEILSAGAGNMMLVNVTGTAVYQTMKDSFLKICPSCAEKIQLKANNCPHCQKKFNVQDDIKNYDKIKSKIDAERNEILDAIKLSLNAINEKKAADFRARALCKDGNCIGVIGQNGSCKECGKSENWIPPNK